MIKRFDMDFLKLTALSAISKMIRVFILMQTTGMSLVESELKNFLKSICDIAGRVSVFTKIILHSRRWLQRSIVKSGLMD